MGIIIKNVPVKAHHFIGLVERYHGPLCQVYTIITAEILEIKPELVLQMCFKAFNDLVRPNGLVPTLLVFGAYLCMTEMDVPLSTIIQRNIAMQKAMEEVRKSNASHQVDDALNTQNGPSTSLIHDLPLNSPVLVFCERNTSQSRSWKGPYKLLSPKSKLAIIELSNGLTKFCSTSIKLYYDSIIVEIDKDVDEGIGNSSSENCDIFGDWDTASAHVPLDISSSSAPSISLAPPTLFASIKHWHGRLKKHPKPVNFIISPNICFIIHNPEDAESI